MKKSHKNYKNDFTGFLSLPHQVSIISGEDCDSLTTTIFLCRRCLLTPTRYLGDNSGTGPSLEAVSVA